MTSPSEPLVALAPVAGTKVGRKILRFIDPDHAVEVVIEPEESKREWNRMVNGPRGASGWGSGGTPQCSCCRRLMSGYNQKCTECHGWSQQPNGRSN